ncbi:hypothetical protein C496_23643 [Natronorubrum tibetense GA33]|uniref:Uncharacterized protein n=1 Tax=Natronorubrum tibetense GA33 TaxID=1114856 RepID=L9VEA6_9EURY|nr:hypothetical protein C496_23643 [Natronorubrum tibetense GA33]
MITIVKKRCAIRIKPSNGDIIRDFLSVAFLLEEYFRMKDLLSSQPLFSLSLTHLNSFFAPEG